MAGLTPKLPLALGGESGNYQLIQNYKDLIKQNFKNLILTSPGERMMDPHFGVGIRNFLSSLYLKSPFTCGSAQISLFTRTLPFVHKLSVLE